MVLRRCECYITCQLNILKKAKAEGGGHRCSPRFEPTTIWFWLIQGTTFCTSTTVLPMTQHKTFSVHEWTITSTKSYSQLLQVVLVNIFYTSKLLEQSNNNLLIEEPKSHNSMKNINFNIVFIQFFQNNTWCFCYLFEDTKLRIWNPLGVDVWNKTCLSIIFK